MPGPPAPSQIPKPMTTFLRAACLSLLLSPPLFPQVDPFGSVAAPGGDGEEWTRASLVAEPKSIAPGEPFTVALELDHPDGWHSYYRNSGGLELPLAIEWTLPEGFSHGPIQWPTPAVKDGFFGKSYIYEGSPTFLVEITPSADIQPGGSVTLTADARWQICEQLCKDEPHDGQAFTLTLAVATEATADPDRAALFARARAAQPAPPEGFTIEAIRRGPQIELRVTPPPGAAADPGALQLDFIPNEAFVDSLSGSGGSVSVEGGTWVLPLDRRTLDPLDEPIPQGDSLSGVLVAKGAGLTGGSRSVAIPATTLAEAPAPPMPVGRFLGILGGMLVGGMILNLMPCVFPVLGLKIMGFVQQSGEDRRKVALHGVAFTVGVLLSFAVLSGLLFFVRENSASEINWGYQLQNKWFVYGLVMLFWIFGLSMFGLFEVGTSATSVGGRLQSKDGLQGSFFSGILATVAATPCSAPFLGPAIGAAVALPAFQFFAAFTAMALGLSLPYLVLSIFPKLVGFLPRPGPWMESFKQGMAFLLIGAAAYFFWVYIDHVEQDILYLVLIGFVLIAMAAWIYGRWSTPARKPRVRWIARGLTIAIGGLGFHLATGPYAGLKWETWSPQKVEALLEEGRPVYVDFTAKWCATCQANKKVAYTPEVIALFRERGVATLKADKTLPDPEIDARILELGRAAIPVNVLHVPGSEPVITPEVLTPAYLRELILSSTPAGTE